MDGKAGAAAFSGAPIRTSGHGACRVLERPTSPLGRHVSGEFPVPECKSCGEDADELVSVTVDGKKRRLCEACAELAKEQDAIAEESEAVVQKMMDFKGRR